MFNDSYQYPESPLIAIGDHRDILAFDFQETQKTNVTATNTFENTNEISHCSDCEHKSYCETTQTINIPVP